ncbi:hypothetical protein AHIS1_p068 [Acaryochloris phage A-HIS1]|nr:hypothetical protein AHIS1_p068 [Acaryochloris phage A-HIS1]
METRPKRSQPSGENPNNDTKTPASRKKSGRYSYALTVVIERTVEYIQRSRYR